MENVPQEMASRFERTGELAKRPNCIVYRGRDRKLDREVAIKVFVDRASGDAAAVKAFDEEIEKLRTSTHHALVPIIGGGEEGGTFYIAMELINGPTLRERMKEKSGPFDLEKAVQYIAELASAVGEIHERGTIHGHIDPRGILFKGESVCLAGYYPRTIDRLSKSATMAEARMTIDPTYIAPEQIDKPETADGRADIYSLSIILYELVTGARPFTASNPLQTAMMRLSEKPPSPAKSNANVGPLLDAAILKGLSRDPKDRFQSTAEFADAIVGGKRRATGSTQKAEAANGSGGGESPERLTGTETIAVSMSSEVIQKMLKAHEAQAASPPKSESPAGGVASTMTGMPATGMSATETMSGRLDVAATIAGVDVAKILKPSFIFLDGPKKGTRFGVEKAQIMVGSDPSCDISLAEKNVPRRLALVVQRGSDYFVEALGGEALEINGAEAEEATDGVKLKRGDVISVGGFGLRYIAPGEVFTLHDDVADRTIDRPKSKLPALLLAGLVIIALGSFGGMYLYQQRQEEAAASQRALEKTKQQKREDLIAQLRTEGDDFFKSGAFSEPVGANAKEKFEKILELDHDNPYAKRRLADIKDREAQLADEKARREQFKLQITKYLDDGELYFTRGDYVSPPGRNAREMYRQVLNLDPSNDTAKKRIAEIDKIIGDVLGRVGGLLQKAKGYIDNGQYVLPKGENAYDVIQEVLKVDPGNEEAKNYLLDMAARSVFEGDVAKEKVQPKIAKQKYLTAQALGVDPTFIQARMQGIELMGKTQSSVIIVNHKNDQAQCKKDQETRYLNCEELTRRIASLSLNQRTDESPVPDSGREYHDLGRMGGN